MTTLPSVPHLIFLTVQAQCSSTQETLLRTDFNRLLLDRKVLASLQLTRQEVSCYYKYIAWLDDDTYSFEEVVQLT